MCIITSINLPSSTHTNFHKGIAVYGTTKQSSWHLLTIDHTELQDHTNASTEKTSGHCAASGSFLVISNI